ncbi:hypothetical protein J6590_081617 [Homalodisca vitripennis]|nr:hypothetical protein J6590_081617 [Homalodisca vitripennis]
MERSALKHGSIVKLIPFKGVESQMNISAGSGCVGGKGRGSRRLVVMVGYRVEGMRELGEDYQYLKPKPLLMKEAEYLI